MNSLILIIVGFALWFIGIKTWPTSRCPRCRVEIADSGPCESCGWDEAEGWP